MANAKRAAQWFLDNNFVITLDLELAREQRLLTGIKDALNQVDEAFMQVSAVKAGFTVNELSGLFPRHKKSRFADLMLYSNQVRTKGNVVKLYPQEVQCYKERIEKYLPHSNNILEAKLLAYNDLVETEEQVYPISSYEQGLEDFNI